MFVVMRTYHGLDNYHNVQVMYLRRPNSVPQVLARWSGPHQTNYPEYIQESFKHCNATDFQWPELGVPVILNQDQLLKVRGRWMQPLRIKEGNRTEKKPYLKVKKIHVPRNGSVNIATTFPGCEVLKVQFLGFIQKGNEHEFPKLTLPLNRKSATEFNHHGYQFWATVNKSAVRFRQTLGQWRISMSSEDQNITSFTVLVTIKKEA